ncbi:HAMP domain-containing histidine kinase [candidate division KSB1 bacterium]|nr:HAMP domain-containing histidine kinase [candidate division KSB1 bacterium]
MHRVLYRLSGRFKTTIFFIGVCLIIFMMLYSQSIVMKLRAQSRSILEFYANIYSRAIAEENVENLNFIFEQIVRKSNFPIINTDKDKNPNYWEGIGIDPDDRSPETIERVRRIMVRLEQEMAPIPLLNPYSESGDEILGYLYYGDSKLITRLIWFPYVEIIIVGLFVLISFLGFRSIKKSEQQFIWVGMAKETAHQLGTPLSSLMGWIELMKSDMSEDHVIQTIPEMENDIGRLYKVTTRFSQIGSQTELKRQSVIPIIHDVAEYFRRRLPHMGKQISINERYDEVPDRMINRDLFEWVIENLIKNALDSIEKEKGIIDLSVDRMNDRAKRIYIDVKDNGKGILTQNRRLIFRPGFSTKKRGWGLGLNLSKRIIEEYHGGKLVLKDTRIGEGTCMRIII